MQRKISFANNEYYHIFNRGVDKRKVFLSKEDYNRFLVSMDLLNDEKDGLMLAWRDLRRGDPKAKPLASQRLRLRNRIVKIIAYCLNSNHYHFILQQSSNEGIEKFMQKLGTSYTMYFNKKFDRSGALFQGPFKSIHIDSNEYLLYLSAYVNANHFIHGKSKGLAFGAWPYSSLLDYTGRRNEKLCSREPILSQFDNDFSQYEKYLSTNAKYFKDKKEMEKYILE